MGGGDGSDGGPPNSGSYNPRTWLTSASEAVPIRKKSGLTLRTATLVTVGAFALAMAFATVFLMQHQSRAVPRTTFVGHTSLPTRLFVKSRRVMVVNSRTDLAAILRRADVDPQSTTALATAARPFLSNGATKISLDLRKNISGHGQHVEHAALTRPDGGGAVLLPHKEGFIAVELSSALTAVVRVARGQIDSESFYTSAVSAGIDDRLIPEITGALAFDFDFVREIHAGDVFEIAVEEHLNRDGEAFGPSRLIYVSLVTQAKQAALYSFRASGAANADWFTGDGRTVRRALMRTPVEGARVTSTFGMRMHPVLGYTRMHKGVDFGVPVGTPVFASGDGTIDFLGLHGGHGLYLRIAHAHSVATGYAHLSRFVDSLRIGAFVHQGQVVAFSGSSGLSTGPHLHYEIWVSGNAVDPLTFTVGEGTQLAGAALAAFKLERERIDALRQRAM